MRNLLLGLSLLVCLAALGEGKEYVYTNEYGSFGSNTSDPLVGREKVYAVDSILFRNDSDLSQEQRALKLKLMYVDAFLTDAEGNSPRLTVGEEYFVANGIPVKYYHDMVARCKDVAERVAKNKFFEKMDMAEYRQRLRELYTRFFKEHAATGITLEDFFRVLVRESFDAMPADMWYAGPVPEKIERPIMFQHFEIDRLLGCDERRMIPEELAMKRKLEYVREFCTKAVDNHAVLTVGKDYFRENGIPEKYYDQLIARIRTSEDQHDYYTMKEYGKVVDRAKGMERHRKLYAAFLDEYLKTGIFYEDFIENVIERQRQGETFPWDE